MLKVRLLAALVWAVVGLAACSDPDHKCTALGVEGCPCAADDSCQAAAAGEDPLVCQQGICVATPSCRAGSADCACAPFDRCASGLTCAAANAAGERVCTPVCPKGELGCACFADKSCGTADDGVALLCGLGSCVRADCEAGSAGCLCDASDECAHGYACSEGFCAVDTGQTLVPPKNPRCYTPCQGGGLTRTVDGKDTFVACSSDGLIEGCIGDAVCLDGTCASTREPADKGRSSLVQKADPADNAAGACQTDIECPSYQSCVQGKCYSDCEADSDCRGERRCHRKACRLPCDATKAAGENGCSDGTYCESSDATSGFCLPLSGGAGTLAEITQGSFSTTPGLVEFTSSKITGSFAIVNDSQAFQEFVVRRRYHREYADGQTLQVDKTPLSWLRIGAAGQALSADGEIRVGVEGNGGKLTIAIEKADNPKLDRWDGMLEIEHRTLGVQEVPLTYRRLPEGQWGGEMFYLANFGTTGLEAWRASKDDDAIVRSVGNALVQRWHAVRKGRISMREFKAVLTATRDETWKVASVREKCPSRTAPNPNVGCYMYDNNDGLAVYSNFLPDAPIPSGATGFPIAINLHPNAADATAWGGKIVSDVALQYAGDPAVALRFAGDPSSCGKNYGDTCLTFITGMTADVIVGGRYATTAVDTSCAGSTGFAQVAVPWLVPGFQQGTTLDLASNSPFRYECRDTLYPFGSSSDVRDLNLSLAAANPIPKGQSLKRRLRVLDGALVNQSELFILFEEQFPSPLDPSDVRGFNAYGYMLLKRSPADLDAAAYVGSVAADNRPTVSTPAGSCDSSLLNTVLSGAANKTLTASNVNQVAQVVVQGAPVSAVAVAALTATSAEQVHYYCEDTGYFDGGPSDDGSAGAAKVACPAGSKVEFFTLSDDAATVAVEGSNSWLSQLSCQREAGTCRAGQPCTRPVDCSSFDGTPGGSRDATACAAAAAGCAVGASCSRKGNCGATLAAWRAQAVALGASNGDYGPLPAPGQPVTEAERYKFRVDPVWSCKDPNAALCDATRTDLRADRDFYPRVANSDPTYRSLASEVDQAFRYKTKFQGREGTSLGFTPDICVSGSDLVPYCYDPPAIEQIQLRVDCATHLYTSWYPQLSADTKSLLKSYLTRSFAYVAQREPNRATPRIIDGFEHLNAELLVMLGDDALADASASRFDLAGQRVAPFPGDELEPSGIRLSGGAGFEMFSLYLATQYYQQALDRFFGLGPLIWRSIGTGAGSLPPGEGFITQATATSWFARLIGASAHKAKAWSEVARRYQSFNRPDLARLVTQRGYTAAYMEAALLSRIMFRLTDTADAADVAQIVSQVELAQRTYGSALRKMQEVYESISDDVTLFGFPPDYVPFPALSRASDTSAFQEVLARAQDRVADASDKEQKALDDRRAFETDAAAFQSELSALRISYDEQLAAICGSFEATNPEKPSDVRLVPAIPENAALDERLIPLGDPCGHVGNGSLLDAMLAAEQTTQAMAGLRLSQRHLMEKILSAEARANEQCASVVAYADWTLKQENTKIALSTVIEAVNLGIDAIDRFASTTDSTLGTLACAPLTGQCPVSAAIATTQAGLSTGWNLAVLGLKATTSALSLGKEAIDSAEVVEGILQGCDAAKLDAKYTIKELFRDAEELGSATLEQAIAIKAAVANVETLRNQATALLDSRAETLSHLINVEAAQNDPNVRIYTQDSVFSAERTFRRALQEAYKATKVFEYYTNQSYAAKNDLFLVRMVQYGEPSLESYLADLEDAYLQFEEQYGKPDLRVIVVSMRDDILKIPQLGGDGTALTQTERVDLFRAALSDPRLLDANGYVSAPFATDLARLSPLTFNHKIRVIEAELVMDQNQGDDLARVYLSQRGTSTVRTAARELSFYSFPERTAVLDTFFNGDRSLDASLSSGEQVYSSERLRDRPLVNSGWSLAFNQKDEAVNQDIDLASIDDIRLYLFYTDFTEL